MYRQDSHRLKKILANHISGKGLVPRIFKDLSECNNQKAISWEIGIAIHTALCIKLVTNEDLLFSSGNSAQSFAGTQVGSKSKKGDHGNTYN